MTRIYMMGEFEMVDYKKMYVLLSEAASDSLDILSSHADEESINWVRFLLQQALMRSEHIYTVTASGLYGVEGEPE